MDWLQHTRLPCPSPSPWVCANSCLLSQWCHPAISFSVAPFSSCLQSFPASGSFPWVSSLSQVAKVFSISPSNEYSALIGWFDLLAVQRTLKSLFQHWSSTASILWCSVFFMVQLSHPWVTTGKLNTKHKLSTKHLIWTCLFHLQIVCLNVLCRFSFLILKFLNK